jgi:hypothetical protein
MNIDLDSSYIPHHNQLVCICIYIIVISSEIIMYIYYETNRYGLCLYV